MPVGFQGNEEEANFVRLPEPKSRLIFRITNFQNFELSGWAKITEKHCTNVSYVTLNPRSFLFIIASTVGLTPNVLVYSSFIPPSSSAESLREKPPHLYSRGAALPALT